MMQPSAASELCRAVNELRGVSSLALSRQDAEVRERDHLTTLELDLPGEQDGFAEAELSFIG